MNGRETAGSSGGDVVVRATLASVSVRRWNRSPAVSASPAVRVRVWHWEESCVESSAHHSRARVFSLPVVVLTVALSQRVFTRAFLSRKSSGMTMSKLQ
ncbi:hypothetical protein J6590_047731 [Homalodisca vitripennis]|nr:hypothetical protein J6590_047731 [Homalodisca vitripennis]